MRSWASRISINEVYLSCKPKLFQNVEKTVRNIGTVMLPSQTIKSHYKLMQYPFIINKVTSCGGIRLMIC
jgi:hypothetical protein